MYLNWVNDPAYSFCLFCDQHCYLGSAEVLNQRLKMIELCGKLWYTICILLELSNISFNNITLITPFNSLCLEYRQSDRLWLPNWPSSLSCYAVKTMIWGPHGEACPAALPLLYSLLCLAGPFLYFPQALWYWPLTSVAKLLFFLLSFRFGKL